MGVTLAQARNSVRVRGAAIALLEFVRQRTNALLAFGVPFALFLLSANHNVGGWDTAEMQGVPYILGIPHPTGFPLYVLCGYVFSHVFAIGSVAFRLNIFSSVCMAGCSLVLYLVAKELSIPKFCGLVGAWWFCVTTIVWNHAIRAEVHDLALLLCTISVYFNVRWLKRADESAYLFGAGAFGLALATHPLAIWLLPGIVVTSLIRMPKCPVVVRATTLMAAPLLLYAYLPIRSFIILREHLDPTVGLAGLQGSLFWNENNPSSWPGFLSEVTGSQFGAGHTLFSAINSAVLQGYLWNWLSSVNGSYGAYGMILGFIGLSRLWAADWRTTLSLLVLCLAIVPFSYAYANVEGDSDRYRMLSLWIIPLFMAGAAGVKAQADYDLARIAQRCAVFVLMLTWTIETFGNNRGIMDNHSGPGDIGLIAEAAMRIPPGAIVVTPWFDATTLAYGAYVDGSFKGRIVVSGWPNDVDRHFSQWLKHYPIYVIWNVKPDDYAGLRFIPETALDNSHLLWRVARAGSPSHGKRATLHK